MRSRVESMLRHFKSGGEKNFLHGWARNERTVASLRVGFLRRREFAEIGLWKRKFFFLGVEDLLLDGF